MCFKLIIGVNTRCTHFTTSMWTLCAHLRRSATSRLSLLLFHHFCAYLRRCVLSQHSRYAIDSRWDKTVPHCTTCILFKWMIEFVTHVSWFNWRNESEVFNVSGLVTMAPTKFISLTTLYGLYLGGYGLDFDKIAVARVTVWRSIIVSLYTVLSGISLCRRMLKIFKKKVCLNRLELLWNA